MRIFLGRFDGYDLKPGFARYWGHHRWIDDALQSALCPVHRGPNYFTEIRTAGFFATTA